MINEQKDRFREEIILSDDWKERYMIIKRFEKKKIKKDDDFKDNDENKEDENIGGNREGLFCPQDHAELLMENSKKKYSIKNG